VGVILMPGLDECVYAAVGHGAWYVHRGAAPRAARVSAKRHLSEGLFCTTSVQTFGQIGRDVAYLQLQTAARLTRTWGDCYGYLLVGTARAEGRSDPQRNV